MVSCYNTRGHFSLAIPVIYCDIEVFLTKQSNSYENLTGFGYITSTRSDFISVRKRRNGAHVKKTTTNRLLAAVNVEC